MWGIRLKDGSNLSFNQPIVMGIVNLSPDSFYAPHTSIDSALHAAQRHIAEGALILDLGAEATNPSVAIEQNRALQIKRECERLVPLIKEIKSRWSILVSVDTSEPEVMHAVVSAGADMINDQRHLSRSGAVQAVCDLGVPVCLMCSGDIDHQAAVSYSVSERRASFFQAMVEHVQHCIDGGIEASRIILDPGFGQGHYGKTLEENYDLVSHLSDVVALGYPVLVGVSRKSIVGDVLSGCAVDDRLFGTIALQTLLLDRGAHIIRSHDVKAAHDAISIVMAMRAIGAGDQVSKEAII